MADDDVDMDMDMGDDGLDGSDDDLDFEEEDQEDELDEELDENEDELVKDDEYLSEEDDDLTDFQKMLINKQKTEFRTTNRLTKYEFTDVIGFRAQQLAEGAPPLTLVGVLNDPISIALKEYQERVLPYVIERRLPSNKIGLYTYETRGLDELINITPPT